MNEKVKKWIIKADEFYIPTLEEAKRAFETAKKAKEFIFRKMEIREDELK